MIIVSHSTKIRRMPLTSAARAFDVHVDQYLVAPGAKPRHENHPSKMAAKEGIVALAVRVLNPENSPMLAHVVNRLAIGRVVSTDLLTSTLSFARSSKEALEI